MGSFYGDRILRNVQTTRGYEAAEPRMSFLYRLIVRLWS
jgi:hypothetical protein